MIKKIMMVLALITLVFSASFADVYIKDLDGTNVEVVFTFKDDAATEMAVIGDFVNWVEPGVPMAKNADGKWEVSVKSTVDGVLKYKFWYKGTYIYDFKSPDKIDDGFGGNNGLIEVSKVLAKQKAAELAASGDAAGAAALMAQAGASSGLKFVNWSMFGFQTKFTLGDKVETESAGLNLQSYWKATGNAAKNMPIYLEIAVAEQNGFDNLYKKDVREWKDGFKNLLVDTVFDPVRYYGGDAADKTYLGHFKAGFENDWFSYTAGYKYAKLPPHTNVSWNTVTDNWDAGYANGGGYAAFATGNGVTEWFNNNVGAKIKAAVVPNRTADRAGYQYGMYAWASAEFAGQYVDVQYNGAYGKTFDAIFGNIYETDVIVGYQGKFGPFTAKANYLFNIWGDGDVAYDDEGTLKKSKYSPMASDVKEVLSAKNLKDYKLSQINNMAANVQVVYSDDYMDATLGGRFRGSQANMMYVKQADADTMISDQLGDLNTLKAWLNYNYKLVYGNVGIEPYMVATLDKDALVQKFKDPASMEIGGKLFGGYDFDVVKFDSYINMNFVTKVEDSFKIGDAGVKVETPLVLDGLSFMYGYDPASDDATFHTGIFELKGIPAGITAQTGFGYRAKKDGAKVDYTGKEFGFFVGANMKLNFLLKPVLYTQFLWNMDPYKGFSDGQDNLDMDGYVTGPGVADYAGEGAFRIALRWDF